MPDPDELAVHRQARLRSGLLGLLASATSDLARLERRTSGLSIDDYRRLSRAIASVQAAELEVLRETLLARTPPPSPWTTRQALAAFERLAVSAARHGDGARVVLCREMAVTDHEAGDVLAELDVLRCVAFALIDNARRYARVDGRVQVFTGGERRDDAFCICLRDDGPGIARTDRALVFEDGYRTAHATRVCPDGTGHGLYLARKLLRRTGGDLLLGAGKRGAMFEVLLPLAPE